MSKLLDYERGQDYIYISDIISETLKEHSDDKELILVADRFRAYLGDKLDQLGSHDFGIYNGMSYLEEHGTDNFKYKWPLKEVEE